MKTLEVIPSVSSAFGGPSEVVLNLTREIRNLGVDAEIATTNDCMTGVMDVPLGQRVLHHDVPIWFFPRFPLRMKEFLFSASLSQWLWINLNQYDFVTAHYLFSYAPSCLAMMARLQNIPYAVRSIGQLTPWSLSQGRLKKKIYSNLIERRNLNHAYFIHCTTDEEAHNVHDFGIKTPKVILPLGVTPSPCIPQAKLQLQHRYNIPDGVPVILFLSRLHYKKRLEMLIQVLSEIRQQSFHLVIAGTGEQKYVNSLHELVATHHLQAQTTFAGFVTGLDKDILFQGSDLFVLPTYSENFGIVLAEAMVAGLPVVTTPGAQISTEISQAHAGIIINDQSQLQDAISLLLRSPQLREELGKNGKNFAVQRYSWPSIAQQFVTLYSDILHHKQLPEFYSPLQSEPPYNLFKS